MTDLQRRWDAVMMGNYGTPAVTLVRGEGATVWDDEGRFIGFGSQAMYLHGLSGEPPTVDAVP